MLPNDKEKGMTNHDFRTEYPNEIKIRLGVMTPDGSITNKVLYIYSNTNVNNVMFALANDLTDREVVRNFIECKNDYIIDKNVKEFMSHGDKHMAYFDGEKWTFCMDCGKGYILSQFTVDKSKIKKEEKK